MLLFPEGFWSEARKRLFWIPSGPLFPGAIKIEEGIIIAKPDILKHELVPEHEVMSKKDINAVLKEYNITKGQLPKIMSNDPVVKRIKAESGDVIRITRNSKTAGKSVFYRVVVSQV
jgi:DNA-directed RNA polymerase subunit H